MAKCFIFPGQGSQKRGMGEELFQDFKTLTGIADQVLGYSIQELCSNTPKRLKETQYTQPALFAVSALSYLKHFEETSERPDFMAGHSLGEYNALFAAGAFDFETGMKLVKKRGELMSEAGNGGMAAILGVSSEKADQMIQDHGLGEIDVANYNCHTQTVVSGPKEELEKAQGIFDKEEIRFLPLNVSSPFHSRYMESAKGKFKEFLDEFEFNELKIPVIANTNALPYQAGKTKENLTEQITTSVRWTESVEYLLDQGSMEFRELGTGDVLTKLVDKIKDNQ